MRNLDKKKIRRILFCISITLSFLMVHGQRKQNSISKKSLPPNLTGTWISKEDPKWKIVFNSEGTCYWYFNNELTDTFNYLISNTSPQCGYNVKASLGEDFYLNLTDKENDSQSCYEILGVDDKSLSLGTIDTGVKYYSFIKQQ